MGIKNQIVRIMNTHSKYCLEVWIGLAKVQADSKQSVLKNANNAYVNVLGLARNRIEFKKIVGQALSDMNLRLNRLENSETFSKRITAYKVDKLLYRLAKELLEGNTRTKVSTFHTYE
jgi:hypothetical protein